MIFLCFLIFYFLKLFKIPWESHLVRIIKDSLPNGIPSLQMSEIPWEAHLVRILRDSLPSGVRSLQNGDASSPSPKENSMYIAYQISLESFRS